MHSKHPPRDGIYGINSAEGIFASIPSRTARERVLARRTLARRAFELFPHEWIEGRDANSERLMRDENERDREAWLCSMLDALGLRGRVQYENDLAEVKAQGGLRL